MPTLSSIDERDLQPGTPAAPRWAGARGGRWMHVVPHLDARYGGLSSVVPQLVSELTENEGLGVEIAAFCTPEETLPSLLKGITVTRWPLERGAWLRNRTLGTDFRNEVTRFDGVHIHGLWEQSTFVAARAARALGKPYVISAHGMLDQWALAHKRAKKLVYGALIERHAVRSASYLHALTETEAGDYRRFGSVAPVAVIPNGVTVPPRVTPAPFYEQYPALRGRRLLLFLGRIHPKKGVEVLVRSWAELAAAHPEAHLVLAGPDFAGTRGGMETLVAALGISSRVTFTGMLRDEMKWSALAAATVFVLPSLSEGFSVSVLEAMGMGLPVIISPACHLPRIGDGFAGWIAQSEQRSLASTLQQLLLNSPEANEAMGGRGRQLVAEHYSWPAIAAQMAEVYRSVASGAKLVRESLAKSGKHL